MKHEFLCALALLAVILSCQKEGTGGQGSIEDYVASVAVSNHGSNSLRVNVDIVFKKGCDYSIRYWRKDDPNEVRTTKVRHTEGDENSVTLMFMYEKTEYEFEVDIEGTGLRSKPLSFQTRSLPSDVTQYSIDRGVPGTIPGYIMQTAMRNNGYMTIADTDGNVLWYQHSQPEGRDFTAQFDVFNPCLDDNKIWFLNGYLFTTEGGAQSMGTTMGCVDFEGNVSHFWASSDGTSPTPLAHHEIHELKDGNILVVGSSQKPFDLTPIGGAPGTVVSGDGYTVFTKEGKIVSQWDCFCEIDPVTCPYTNAKAFYWDIVHGNSLGIDSEGYYYMSFNRINQIWKIDPQTGKVLYRVGENGNVAMDPKGYPSGVHAATPLSPDRILCLDNGIESTISRGLIYKVDPGTMTAKVETIVELPVEYASYDRSNASLICNGSYLMFGMTNSKVVVFTDLDGNIAKTLRTSVASYRTLYLDRLPIL